MVLGAESGKAIGGIVEGLKSQPLCLSMILINGAMVALIWWALSLSTEIRQMEHKLTHETQKQTQELLARCRLSMRNHSPATQGAAK